MIVKEIVNLCPSMMSIVSAKTGHEYYHGNGYDVDRYRDQKFLNLTVNCFTCVQRTEQNSFSIQYYSLLKIFVEDEIH